ncbi:MAG TPA: hypothetical protein VFU15_00380 [Bacteroidia bacterium]|nr:hypothetical protein [Bacteroidia bacterium]
MKKAFIFLLPFVLMFSCRKDDEVYIPENFVRYYGTSGDEMARKVLRLPGGDLMIAGYGLGPNGGNDVILLKTDMHGNQKWMKYYGGAGNEQCWSVDLCDDGNVVLGATTSSQGAGADDFWIIKADTAGNVIWSKTYGRQYNDDLTHLVKAPNGYLAVGISNSGHDDNAWTLRLDENGDSLWSYNWGGNMGDGAMSAIAIDTGGFVVTGYYASTQTNGTDGFLLLLNDSGVQVNLYTYGTGHYDEPHAIVPAIDGDGWVVCGHYGDVEADLNTHNVFLEQIGRNGVKKWRKEFGGAMHDGGEDLVAGKNAYYIAGRSNSHAGTMEDVFYVKTDAGGNLLDQQWFGTDADDEGYGICVGKEAVIICGASSGGPSGGKDIYLQQFGDVK